MTDKEMFERTKLDLKNFNSRVEMLRQCELRLNEFQKQEDPPQEESNLLELKIRRIKLNIKIMKNSFGLLTSRELEIITDYYFANNSTRNTAIKLNLSEKGICVIRRKAVERLAKCMYEDAKILPFILEYREIPGE